MLGGGVRAPQLSRTLDRSDRRFTEVDVRGMLQLATRLRRDIEPGRWVAVTRHRRARWEVIVEPDGDAQMLVVITAYPAE